jgi:hypothetical protein
MVRTPSAAARESWKQLASDDDDDSDGESGGGKPIETARERRGSFVGRVRRVSKQLGEVLGTTPGTGIIAVTAHGQTPQQAVQALTMRLRKQLHNEQLATVVAEWYRDYWPHGDRYDEAWAVEFFQLLCCTLSELIGAVAAGKAGTLVALTLISVSDTLSDVIVAIISFYTLSLNLALAQAGLLAFALLAQAMLSAALGQGWLSVALSLVGLKPVLDAHREISQARPPPTQVVNHALAAALTRGTELATESLPLGMLQMSIVMTSSWEHIHTAQLVSLVFSVLAIAVIGSQTTKMLDQNPKNRAFDSVIFGFYPPQGVRASLVEWGDILLCGGYCTSRLIALAAIGIASRTVAFSWLACECLLFLAWRVLEDEWRFGLAGMDGFGTSLSMHIVSYLGFQVYPAHWIARLPAFTGGPQVYATAVLGNLVLTGPAQLAVALWLLEADKRTPFQLLSTSQLCVALGISTTVALLGGAMVLGYMNPSYRHTFYQRLPARQHIFDYHWNTRTTAPIGAGLDAARASTLMGSLPFISQRQR